MLRNAFIDWLKTGLADRPPLVMGILNITPDSFSDGGQFKSVESAAAHAEQMLRDGADLIDIGGESTRPGAAPVAPDEQLRRILPVIKIISRQVSNDLISIDTTSSVVAAAVLDEGVPTLINDVSAGTDDPMMFPMAARVGCPIILMHRPAPSATMQDHATYSDVVHEVALFLQQRVEEAVAAGVRREMILLDPGIGFGKTLQHDLALLRHIKTLKSLGHPLVIGVSRKKFIGHLTGEEVPAQRVFGTAAAVAWSVASGGDIVRVHDVAAMKQTVAVAHRFREQMHECTAQEKMFVNRQI